MSKRNDKAQAIFKLVKALNTAIFVIPEGMYVEIDILKQQSIGQIKPLPYLEVTISELYEEEE